jgi:hypothetical protein
MLVVHTAARVFGAFLTEYTKLLRSQFGLPLLFGLGDAKVLRLHILRGALA